MLQSILFILIATAAFSYSGYRISILLKLMKAHQGKGRPLNEIGARLKEVLIDVFGQRATLRKPSAGIMHATIFWGFIVITFGTTEQFLSTIIPGANFEFIGRGPYSAWVFLHDIFTVAVLLAVFYACFRRFVIRPPGLGKSQDANRILFFTASLMVSIFLMNSFHFRAEHPWFAASMPFSNAFEQFLIPASIDSELSHTFFLAFKWIHMLLVLGFAMYIPHSKHLHVLAAGPNTFFKNLRREKAMSSIAFEDESITQYGAAKVTDLSWKDTLDYYACTECGRCQDLCPAWNTQKPLSPKLLIINLKNNMYRNKEKILAGKYDEVEHIVDQNNTEDVIWACTSCRACEIACPVYIEQVNKIYDIRRNLVMMESRFPAEIQSVFKNMETNATPWAFSQADRGEWAKDIGVKTMAEDQNVEYLLWVGCAGSYDDRNKKVLRAFASLLKKASIRFSILGKEEQCTGDPARRIGNEYLFQTMAQANVETLNRYAVKKIVTACPHCFNTLKNEYKAFGGNYEVIHHSELIGRLIKEGKLKPQKALDETVTYHDSCYLGRWNGIYDQPRDIVSAIPSARVVEMKNTGEKSMCCGAGGGRMWMEETIGKRVNIARTEQALETQAGVVASACPFCMTMMTDGIKSKDMQTKVQVLDVAELIDQATT